MGKNIVMGMVVCCYAASLFYVSTQIRDLQTTSETLQHNTGKWLSPFIQGMQHKTLHILSSELHADAHTRPVSDVFVNALYYSVKANVNKMSRDLIAVISNGFFPSNFIQTAQVLLEYDFQLLAEAVSRTIGGVSNAYWGTYMNTGDSAYLKAGNKLHVTSQVAALVSAITPLTTSTYIPTQDSWLGNFLASVPNVTFNTFADGGTWTVAFTNSSLLFGNLANAVWEGPYIGMHSERRGWYCGRCSYYFRTISEQMSIIALGPSLSNAEHKFPNKPPAHGGHGKENEKEQASQQQFSEQESHENVERPSNEQPAHVDHPASHLFPSMTNQGKPMETLDRPKKIKLSSSKAQVDVNGDAFSKRD